MEGITKNEEIKAMLSQKGQPGSRSFTESEKVILLNALSGLIEKIAHNWEKYNYMAEYDDLKQVGYIGLEKAAQLYRVESVAIFSTYAAEWINAEMSRYTKKCGNVSEYCFRELSEYNKAYEKLSKGLQREPTRREIAAFLHKEESAIIRAENIKTYLNPVSINTPISGAEDVTIADTLEDHAKSAQEEQEEKELNRALYGIMDELPEEEKRAVYLKYMCGATYKEIAQSLGKEEKEAQKLTQKAIKSLQGKRHKVASYLQDDYIKSIAYTRSGLSIYKHTRTSSTEYATFKRLSEEIKEIIKSRKI